MRAHFLALLVLIVPGAAAAQNNCQFGPTVRVLGNVAAVNQAPVAPLAGVAVGDAFDMSLTFGGDVVCYTSGGLPGEVGEGGCLEMTVGGVTVVADPMLADPCVWGVQFPVSPPFFAEAVFADVPFVTGDVRAVLELNDPGGLVGIGVFEIIDQTIFVPGVTAPGFSASLTLQDAAGTELAVIDLVELSGTPGLSSGGNYCTANANSTGVAAQMAVMGSPMVADNDLTLVALSLPTDSFGYFLVGDTQGFIANPFGSSGNLCVIGGIGRYVGPGEILNSGSQGFLSLQVDLMNTPQPNGFVPTQPGMTWNFTAWFRDVDPMGLGTNNFANGISLTFQ